MKETVKFALEWSIYHVRAFRPHPGSRSPDPDAA